jgi:hypothetical protein
MRRSDYSFYFKAFLSLAIPFILLQLIPYGRDQSNPPVTKEPAWDSPRMRRLVEGACFDCHSNLTRWRWYSFIAPASWVIQNDVDEGREEVNFTEWDRSEQNTEKLVLVVAIDHMPPESYQFFHPQARFTDEQRQAVVDGFRRMLGQPSLE